MPKYNHRHAGETAGGSWRDRRTRRKDGRGQAGKTADTPERRQIGTPERRQKGKKMIRLNLRMFEGGEGGAAGATTGAAPAENGTQSSGASGTPAEGEKPAETVEETPEERAKSYNDLIKGKFRDMYDADVQKVIKSRVGDMKQMQKQMQEQSDIIGLMAKKYGLASDNMADIRTALENDDMF